MIRVFEYGSRIAIRDSVLSENVLTVRFPNTAVLYLRQTKNTPDYMDICIKVTVVTTKKVLDALTVKYFRVQEGVGKIMGGKILD